jgi:hypothetical protein
VQLCCDVQVPVQYQQDLLENLDASAASVEEVDSSGSTSTIIAQVGLCWGIQGARLQASAMLPARLTVEGSSAQCA